MEEEETNPSHPRLLVFLAALLFSTAAPVTKYVTMPALAVSFFRSLVGLVILLIFVLPKYGRKAIRISLREVLCGITYAATSLSFFLALRHTTAANATILFQTTPVFLIPLGFLFLGEKTDIWDLATIGLMMAGIVLCFRGSLDTKGHLGDLFALTGAVSFAFMNILMRKANYLGNLRCLIVGNFVILLATVPGLPDLEASIRDVLLAGSLGIFHMALPFVLYSRALQSLRALEASIYKNLETVAAPIWVSIIVGELPGLWTVAGFFCVLSALILRATAHSSTGLVRRRS